MQGLSKFTCKVRNCIYTFVCFLYGHDTRFSGIKGWENSTMKGFVSCTSHQMLLEWSGKGDLEGHGV